MVFTSFCSHYVSNSGRLRKAMGWQQHSKELRHLDCHALHLQRKTLKKEKEQERETKQEHCFAHCGRPRRLYIYVGRDSLFLHLSFFGTGRQGGREKQQQDNSKLHRCYRRHRNTGAGVVTMLRKNMYPPAHTMCVKRVHLT